jgi:polyribonucleotide nucleotidyltransferase
LAPQRVKTVTDVVKVGDQVKVKVIGMDDRGKVKLSMKAVDQKTGEPIQRTDDREQRTEDGSARSV